MTKSTKMLAPLNTSTTLKAPPMTTQKTFDSNHNTINSPQFRNNSMSPARVYGDNTQSLNFNINIGLNINNGNVISTFTNAKG